jgi:predicted RNA-binding protein YlxR (DUF448 family)
MNKKQPLRQCTGCGETKPKKELIRIVKSPDGVISLDRSGKANGRGAYICPCSDCYKKAVKGRRLEKAFSMQIPENISLQIIKEIDADE